MIPQRILTTITAMMKDPIPMMTRIMMIPMTILMMIPTTITTKMILMITVMMKKNRYCLQ